MSDEDNKVKRLPVKFKQPVPEDRSILREFEVPGATKCSHLRTPYIVDPATAEVECGKCGEKLNPMRALAKLATEDRRYAESQSRYQDEQKRLAERKRTKCENCGRMTRISRA